LYRKIACAMLITIGQMVGLCKYQGEAKVL
jgi:hypothetical protein